MTDLNARPGAAAAGDPPPSMARRVVAMLLMVLGVLLTIGSGACTGLFFIGFLMDGSTGPEFNGADLWMLPLIVGGPFILVGALMWWGGAKLRRKRSSTPPPWTQPPGRSAN